jgi:hypothetical protein
LDGAGLAGEQHADIAMKLDVAGGPRDATELEGFILPSICPIPEFVALIGAPWPLGSYVPGRLLAWRVFLYFLDARDHKTFLVERAIKR